MKEGTYEVIEVRPAERRETQAFVRLSGGMRGFYADLGEYEVGDSVVVEEYEDYRGETAYRVAGKTTN